MSPKPYKFIGFGAMEVTKPYKFIGFGAMEVTKPYKFIGFGEVCPSMGLSYVVLGLPAIVEFCGLVGPGGRETTSKRLGGDAGPTGS